MVRNFLQMVRFTLSLKNTGVTIAVMAAGIIAAGFSENYYKSFIRFVFTDLNEGQIQFVGKNIHLFPSPVFMIVFGMFCAGIFLFLQKIPPSKKPVRLAVTMSLFAFSTIVTSLFHSKLLIAECTACNDGVRYLNWNEPLYDFYIGSGVLVSGIYMCIIYLKSYGKIRNSHADKELPSA